MFYCAALALWKTNSMFRCWEERWGFPYPLPSLSKLPCVWCGQGHVMFSLTLLSEILKVCAILLISDVPFTIPSVSRDSIKFTCLFCTQTNTGWAGQFPVWPHTCKDSKILSCPKLTVTLFMRSSWKVDDSSGSSNFEINHACLEICHHKQMQHWRSQFVFSDRVLPYLKGWDNPLNFLASAVQGSEFVVSEYIWMILSTLLMCMHVLHIFSWNVIMNYQQKKNPNETKLLVWICKNQTLKNCCRFLQHFLKVLLFTWLKCGKLVCLSALQGLKLSWGFFEQCQ